MGRPVGGARSPVARWAEERLATERRPRVSIDEVMPLFLDEMALEPDADNERRDFNLEIAIQTAVNVKRQVPT